MNCHHHRQLRLTDFLRQEQTEIGEIFQRIKCIDKRINDIDHKDLEPDDLKIWWKQNLRQPKSSESQTKISKTQDDNQLRTSIKSLPLRTGGGNNRYRSAPPPSTRDVCQEERQKRYRNDLLRQMEEKQRIKARQEKEEQDQDRVLEDKISQQRLAIYLEYLDDHQHHQPQTTNTLLNQKNRGDDEIEKKKPPKCNTNSSGSIKFDMIRNGSSKNNQNCPEILANKTENASSGSDSRATVENKHLLIDLNEVRRIMQTDHYELLEKLILGDWNMASAKTMNK